MSQNSTTTKPSDRGRHNPEPGPVPTTRSEQRDTADQLGEGQTSSDPALAFERDEQQKLPPRGAGSQHNQGDDHGATVATTPRRGDPDALPGETDGLQSGGDRGSSSQATQSGEGR